MFISSSSILKGRVRFLQTSIFALMIWPLFSMEDQGFIPRPVVFLKAQDAQHIWIRQWPIGQIVIMPLAGCRESKKKKKGQDLEKLTSPNRIFSKLQWVDVRNGGGWHAELVRWGVRNHHWVCSPKFSRPRWQKHQATKIPLNS